jgi:hypothetical protein
VPDFGVLEEEAVETFVLVTVATFMLFVFGEVARPRFCLTWIPPRPIYICDERGIPAGLFVRKGPGGGKL